MKRQSSPMSATTPPSVRSVSSGTQSTSGMSSLTQESTRYKKNGVSFDDFIEDNKDWRSFGSITYEGMKENGYVDILLKKISIYYKTGLLQDWETDREDHVKRLKFLTYPKQEDVILQSS